MHRKTTQVRPVLLRCLLVTACAWAVPTPALAAECEHPSKLCLEPLKGARWAPGESTNAKERSRRSEDNGGTLTLNIEGGRGSVFVNGRYVGTAPLSDVPIPRGKNDIQVRDGERVIAKGVLVVSKGNDLVVTVNAE